MSRNTAQLFGLSTDPSPTSDNTSDQDIAVEWNDNLGYNFATIADLVAYSTEHRLRFVDLPTIRNIPGGYAVKWLGQLDALA